MCLPRLLSGIGRHCDAAQKWGVLHVMKVEIWPFRVRIEHGRTGQLALLCALSRKAEKGSKTRRTYRETEPATVALNRINRRRALTP